MALKQLGAPESGSRAFRSGALAACSLIALLGVCGTAFAGAFALREQSAEGLGEAFAGVAAGSGGLSSMFWNPATLTDMPGWQTSVVASGILPYANLTPQAGTSPFLLPLGASGNIAKSALVPSFYNSYQFSDKLWLGLSFNAPYGLSSQVGVPSAAQVYGTKSTLESAELSPSIAYKITDFLSVGGALRFLYLDLNEQTALLPIPAPPIATLKGNSWALGYSLGATITPFAGTEIGLGYRSRVSEGLRGSEMFPVPVGLLPAGTYPTRARLPLPDSASLGLRQKIGDQFTFTATAEWTHWSILRAVAINGPIPGQTQPFFYRDAWMFSVGGEYAVNQNLTLRAGLGYEQSPITTGVREVRDPDGDRKWASIGLSYKATNKLTLDAGYAHYLGARTPVNIVPGNPSFALVGLPYVGTVNRRLDIVSVGLTYRWDDPAPPPPLVARY